MSPVDQVEWTDVDRILRRTGAVSPCPGRPEVVDVAVSTYHQLLQATQQYYKLRQALVFGGTNDDTLDALIDGYTERTASMASGRYMPNTKNEWTQYTPFRMLTPFPAHNPSFNDHGGLEYPFTLPSQSIEAHLNKISLSGMDQKSFLQSHNTLIASAIDKTSTSDFRQTLLFSKLPPQMSIRDLTQKIRGGRLVEIQLLRREGKALVTFAEGANEYFLFSRKNDIYVGSRRIEICWANKQVKLHAHVQSRLANGQSRNMVIRNAANHFTEQRICNDLEHIDLLIPEVAFKGSDAYIFTNSIRLAAFAKTCLCSQARYKRFMIEWHPDECAQGLSTLILKTRPQARPKGTAVEPDLTNGTNRFLSLNLDGGSCATSETGEDSDGEETSEIEDSDAEASDNSGVNLGPRSARTDSS